MSKWKQGCLRALGGQADYRAIFLSSIGLVGQTVFQSQWSNHEKGWSVEICGKQQCKTIQTEGKGLIQSAEEHINFLICCVVYNYVPSEMSLLNFFQYAFLQEMSPCGRTD